MSVRQSSLPWPEPLSSSRSSPPWSSLRPWSSSPWPEPLLSSSDRRRAAAGAAVAVVVVGVVSDDGAVLGADVGVVGVVTEPDPLTDLAVLDLDVHLHALGAGPEVDLDLAAGGLLDLDAPNPSWAWR